jgi:signal transduction histidine kinase
MSSNSLSSSVDISAHRVRDSYSLAVISVILAFLLRLVVDPWLGDQSPYLLFVVAVAVTGLYAGIRPALLAAGLGTLVAYFCFVPPRYKWGFAGISDAVGFGVYVLGVAGVILLTHARIRETTKSAQQRLKAEAILLKTERLSAEGQMASLLAHEINNPLATLTNIMFLLKQQPLDLPSRELLTTGTDALQRINRIARMTMGFFSDKDAPVSVRIRDIVTEVAETLSSAERFKSIHCLLDFKADPTIVISPPKLKQLIANLLTNAMESGASTVRIRVNVGMWGVSGRRGIRITIADDGSGIQLDDRERMFEPFFSSKSEKGTGLGLWSSRAIVLRNRGSIRLRSEVFGPRKGTCFFVFLPIISESTAPSPKFT